VLAVLGVGCGVGGASRELAGEAVSRASQSAGTGAVAQPETTQAMQTEIAAVHLKGGCIGMAQSLVAISRGA